MARLIIALISLAVAAQASVLARENGNNGNNGQGQGQGAHPAPPKTSSAFKDKIKNVVVLVQENRSFDALVGGLNYSEDIDGLVYRAYCNPKNVTVPNGEASCASMTAANVAADDPNHAISGVNMQLYSTYHPNETAIKAGDEEAAMMGFLTEQQLSYHTNNITRAAEAINYPSPEHLSVLSTLAENYLLFDQWFAAIPGPTNCNRAYITSGTSHGWGNDENFGVVPGTALPQKSIFEQLSEKDIEWINYSNRTYPSAPDASFYNWTLTSGKNATNVLPFVNFLEDAKAGKLPPFTYINPECCKYDSYHPPSPIDLSEKFVKIVYEAIRNSPQWNETLFILTFDEHGGFGDHVEPPVNVPAGDDLVWTETAQDGKNITFDFTRLGVRVPTLLISPWVEKGFVEHKGKNRGGEYTHTSIVATLAELWDLDNLTPRTAWSSTFEHLIVDEFRADTPATMPEPVIW
jgi:phospholipase C